METALTRYFAVANWSDYGYWVISIVMVGFALSGVSWSWPGSFWSGALARCSGGLPTALVLTATPSATATTPTRSIRCNCRTRHLLPQLATSACITRSAAVLSSSPGLFICLNFVTEAAPDGWSMRLDLPGPGQGPPGAGADVLCCRRFSLVPACCCRCWRPPGVLRPYRLRAGGAFLVLAGSRDVAGSRPPGGREPRTSRSTPPLHTPGAKILARTEHPARRILLLDDFTERVNTDISNDAAMLGYAGPPRSFGLYRDGIRIASLPRPGPLTSGYAPAPGCAALSTAGTAERAAHRRLRRLSRRRGVGAGGGGMSRRWSPSPCSTMRLKHGLNTSPACAPADARVDI